MEKYYQTMLNYIHQRPILKKIIFNITKFFPYITFCLYPCVLVYLYVNKSPEFLASILKPLGAFMTVTIFRKIINRPRPYEAMDIVPLKRHKSGESFPSRHAVSGMIIALICLNANIYLGLFALVVATIMCICRILAGVHYISDVLAAIFIAIVFYII
ncbi:MAG: phosphatase PAP2 family protein [Coprobacillus sp.]